MGLFGIDGGVMDEIRCDEKDYLIWHWHPRGTTSASSRRATAIRLGSSLRVKDGSVAVFTYSDEHGTKRDCIEGPYDGILETSNLPIISSLISAAYAGGTPFPAEVYFINLANLIQVKFGVPYFDIFDPRYMDYGFPVAVRGSLNFKITDYDDFIKLHRLDEFSMSEFQTQIRDAVVRYVKQVVTNATEKDGIPATQIERRLEDINGLIESKIAPALHDDFGVTVTRIDVSSIEIDRDSDGYKKLQAITQNKANIFTQAAGSILHSAGSGAAEAVGEATKTLGSAAASLGGAVGGLLGGLGKRKVQTPPPLPIVQFYVAIDGVQTGPFTLKTLRNMAEEGTLTENSLVWKEGMDSWEEARNTADLEELFHASGATPPPLS